MNTVSQFSGQDLFAPISFGGGGGGGGGDAASPNRGGALSSHGITSQNWGSVSRSLGKTTKETIDMLGNDNATAPFAGGGGDSYSGDPTYGGFDGR